MQILPPRASIGEILGQGLSDLAGAYGEHRTALKALKGLGFTDAQAKAYAALSPNIQENAINSLLQQQQQASVNDTINKVLGINVPISPSSMFQAPQEQMAQQPNQPMVQQPQNVAEQVAASYQNPAFRKLQEQQQQAQALQQQQLAPQLLPQKQQQPSQTIQQALGQQEPTLKDELRQVKRQQQALASANLPPQQRLALQQSLDNKEKDLRKEIRGESDVAERKQARTDKETLPYYTEVKQRAEKAEEMVNRINQYEALLDTGNVSSNGFLALMEELGQVKGYVIGDVIGAFGRTVAKAGLTDETQVAKKLAADFMSGAKDFIGSQMPVAEMQLFMERVPNLMQSIEGQRAILRNFKALADKDLATDKTMDAIIDRNGDERPKHLQSKVSKDMKDYKSNMRKTFMESIKLVSNAKVKKAERSAAMRQKAQENYKNLLKPKR